MELLKHTKIKRYVARSRKQEEKIPRGKENDLKNHEHYTPWTKTEKRKKENCENPYTRKQRPLGKQSLMESSFQKINK